MRNSAYQLADILQSWTAQPGSSELQAREALAGDLGLQRYVAEVVTLVRDIETILHGMKACGQAVDDYLDLVPLWYDAVIRPGVSWADGIPTNQSARACIAPENLRALRFVGGLLDNTSPKVISTEQREGLHHAVTDLIALIREEEGLAAGTRSYLLGLAAQMQMLLANAEVFGDEPLRRAAVELGGLLSRTANDSAAVSSTNRPTWQKIAAYLLGTFVAPSMLALGEVPASYIAELGPGTSQSEMRQILPPSNGGDASRSTDGDAGRSNEGAP